MNENPGAVRLYRHLFTIPVLTLAAAGVLAPFLPGTFLWAGIIVAAAIVVVLVFHEDIFITQAGAEDPIPQGALSHYLSLGLVAAALGIGFLAIDPVTFLRSFARSGYTEIGIIDGGSTVIQASALDTAIAPAVIAGVLAAVALPLGGIALFLVKKHDRRTGRIVLATSAGLFLAALAILILRTNRLDHVRGFFSVQSLTIAQMSILFISGLVMVAVFLVIAGVPAAVLTNLSQQGNLWFTVPIGVSVADVVTIAQGFSGLAADYSFMRNIALVGMVVAGLSIIAIMVFGAICLHRELSPRTASHYSLAAALALLMGCVFMYVLGEVGGLIFLGAGSTTRT